MDIQEVAKRILNRIKEEYNKQIKPEDKISFEEFRIACVSHLDIASEVDIRKYKIGVWAVEKKLEKIKRLKAKEEVYEEINNLRKYSKKELRKILEVKMDKSHGASKEELTKEGQEQYDFYYLVKNIEELKEKDLKTKKEN